MRTISLFLLGVFLWAGTVSIKYPQQSTTVTASSGNNCVEKSDGDRLLAYLEMGRITNIQDNGKILSIGLSPQWARLSPTVQQSIYSTIACYAQAQHRLVELIVPQRV